LIYQNDLKNYYRKSFLTRDKNMHICKASQRGDVSGREAPEALISHTYSAFPISIQPRELRPVPSGLLYNKEA